MSINFIIGTGRCGTTLLARLLNAHSRVCVPPELQLVFGYSGNGPRLNEYFSTGQVITWQAADFIKKIDQLAPCQLDKYYDYVSFFNNREYPEKSLKELLTDLYTSIARAYGKDVFFEQTPWYGQRLDIMYELFPAAQFIHMVRDGRDVALSYARTPWWHNSIPENLERWQYEVNKIADDAKRVLNSNQYLEVKYEDLVLDLETSLKRVLNFLDKPFESSILQPENLIDYSSYHNVSLNDSMSPEFNHWNKHKPKIVFTDNVFGWRRSNEDTFLKLTETTRSTLERFGYEI